MVMMEVNHDRSNDSKSDCNEKGDDMIMSLVVMRMFFFGWGVDSDDDLDSTWACMLPLPWDN